LTRFVANPSTSSHTKVIEDVIRFCQYRPQPFAGGKIQKDGR